MPQVLDYQPNWLHLDLKGAVPDEPQLLRWLDWLAQQGYNGIVWEYEDRLPWRACPDTFRPGYDLDAWRRIWARCHELGLEIVPLQQTQGHLDWLLKRDEWAHLREAGQWSELCPNHPDTPAFLTNWLDEAIDLHPGLRFIHLGADETWALGTCERCAPIAQSSPDGAMSIYVEHMRMLCEHVISRGVRPMIWADMFWRRKQPELAERLPEEVILIDWRYDGPGPHETTDMLPRSRMLFGASAVRRGFDVHFALPPLQDRVENVAGWHRQLREGRVSGLIHTTWGRGDSLRPIYGPWEGWLPGLICGGAPAQWEAHPLREAIGWIDEAMSAPQRMGKRGVQRWLEALSMPDWPSQQAVRWWVLAQTHAQLLHMTMRETFGHDALAAMERHVGVDPKRYAQHEDRCRSLREVMDKWADDVRAYWQDAALSDIDEYLDCKIWNLRRYVDAPVPVNSEL